MARPSGGQYAYEELKRRILELELEPGTRLYEPQLATELDISRTPLREALRRLIAENLLDQHATGGVFVPKLDARDIAELYEVRAALESMMASAACTKATPSDITELEGIVARNAALVSFADDAMNLGKALHAKVGAIADNAWALRLHDQVANQMARYRLFTNHTQERRDQALADHRAIFEAVRDGDSERAAAIAHSHVLDARDEALRAIGSQLA
ncbi:GntR family transcriptional regulator [Nocardioides sp. NPDC057577]|uniref:GntR family transcriptional regulator n=1 Tax=unclassified Nocardioides TaxID=2615069 RepID=UPI00365B3D54